MVETKQQTSKKPRKRRRRNSQCKHKMIHDSWHGKWKQLKQWLRNGRTSIWDGIESGGEGEISTEREKRRFYDVILWWNYAIIAWFCSFFSLACCNARFMCVGKNSPLFFVLNTFSARRDKFVIYCTGIAIKRKSFHLSPYHRLPCIWIGCRVYMYRIMSICWNNYEEVLYLNKYLSYFMELRLEKLWEFLMVVLLFELDA